MRRALLPLLLVSTLVASSVAGTDDYEPVRIPFEQPLPPETNHFGVYHERQKVGWGSLSLVTEVRSGKRVYVSRSRFVADVASVAIRGALDFESTDVFEAQWPFRLLEARERKTDMAGTRTLMLRLAPGLYTGEVTENGVTTPLHIEDPGYTLVDRLTVLEWVRWRPAVGRHIRVRELDITNLKVVDFEFVARERAQRQAGATRIGVVEVAMRSGLEGELGTALFDDEGRLLKGPLGKRLELRVESEAQAKDLSLDSELFAFGRAPLVDAIGRVPGIRRLELSGYGRSAAEIPASGRVKIEWNEEDLEARVTIVAGGDGVPATELEIEAARRVADPDSAEHLAVRELAARAVGDAATVEDRIRRLLGFVRGRLRDAWIPFEPALDEVLRDGAGDASELARLFVALARAADLPARCVTGLVYLGDDARCLGGHVWCEVLVRGQWQEVDPTLNQRRVDATHIPYVRGSSDLMPVLRQSRHLQFEVRGVHR